MDPADLNPSLTTTSTDPVSPNGQYRVPASNPFQAAGQVHEIYCYGMRNPYRFSFDHVTGDATFDLATKARLPLRRTVLVMLAGTIPFVSFVAERSVTRDVRARLAASTGDDA